jgi:hypothetical protein
MINWKQLQQELPDTIEVQEALRKLQDNYDEIDYDIVVNVASLITDELTKNIFVDLVLNATKRSNPLHDQVMSELLNDIIGDLKR